MSTLDRPTFQSIFCRHFDRFASSQRLSCEMYRAARSIVGCRTSAMGGHINSCPEGHFDQIAYNSCRHRSCPQCSWLQCERWLDRWRNRLLPCPHHHIVFTLPSELTRIWLFNKAEYANTLFAAASQTLAELLGDPKYLGGRAGLLCALHTWKQTLHPHVHLHCLATAGGLAEGGDWTRPVKSCLLPRKVLMLKFRGKFKSMLRAKVRCGEIVLPPDMTPASLDQMLIQVSRKAWNVKIHDAYRHGVGVVTYLARYLKGGPMAASRLVADHDGQISFGYRLGSRLGSHQGGDGKRQGRIRLPADTFLRRWLEHVPPHRFQTVRGYGLYSGNQHSRLNDARRSLGLAPLADEEANDRSWQEICEGAGMTKACRCPHCGQRLIAHHEFKPGRGPPPIPFSLKHPKEVA